MNKYNRRARPNLRHVVEFYTPSTAASASGELQTEYTRVYRGPFAMEKPMRPTEIVDAGRVQDQQVFLLIGQWCKPAMLVTEGTVAFIPSTQKSYAVEGSATDPWGDKRKVHIRIVDNVSSEVEADIVSKVV